MIDVAAFESFTHGERRYLTNAILRKKSGRFQTSGAPDRPPYQLAFSTFLHGAVEMVGEDVKVNFVFDKNIVEQGLAAQVFFETKDRQRDPLWKKLNTITFADDKSEMGLQAADLYAYLWLSALTNRGGLYVQQLIKQLVAKNRQGFMDFWKREQMETVLKRLNPTQRQNLAAEL